MKVGDYVRTEDGIIQKITDMFVTSMEIATDKGKKIYRYIEVKKSSPNIIDLIEVGDYVNGVEVIGFEYDNDNKKYLQCGVGDYVVCAYYEEDFKSIVTKEQFEAFETIEYKVGD